MDNSISIQSIQRERRKRAFCGRISELEDFQKNLQLPLSDRRFIWNIYGQGGIGKTSLLKQFISLGKEAGGVGVYVDESQMNILEVMSAFSEQLKVQGISTKRFDERYQKYRELKQQVEADPQLPRGISSMLGKAVARAGVTFAKQIPGASLAIDFMGEEGLVEKAGELSTYLSQRFGNKDDVRLISAPVDVATPAFLSDLSAATADKFLVLGFDTFEKTSPQLEEWLRKIIEGDYGEIGANTFFVIAGREKIGTNWIEYSELIQSISLAALSEIDARALLNARGVTESKLVESILRLSGRIPLWLATLSAQGHDMPGEVVDPSDQAIERFLKWVPEENKRRAAISCSLPAWLDLDIVGKLIGVEQSQDLFEWLKAQPFVRKRAGSGWAYHDIVRQIMLRYLRNESPTEWTRLHSLLRIHFEQKRDGLVATLSEKFDSEMWLDLDLSCLYHHLCSEEHAAIVGLAARLIDAIPREPEYLHRISKVMGDCKETLDSKLISEWHGLIERVAVGFTGGNSPELLLLLGKIERVLPSDSEKRVNLALEKVRLYENDGQFEAALVELDSAISRTPSSVGLLLRKASLLEGQEKCTEALSVYQAAIKLAPTRSDAAIKYANALHRQNRLEEALILVSNSISLCSDNSELLTTRAKLHEANGDFEAALSDLSKLVSLRPHDIWNWAEKSALLVRMGRPEDALQSYEAAFKLNPDALVSGWRGDLLTDLGRFEDALISYTKAVELRDRPPASISRAKGRFRIGDLVRYVGPMDFEGRKGRVLQAMGKYEEAIQQYLIAAQRETEDESAMYSALAAEVLALVGKDDEATEHRGRAIASLSVLLETSHSGNPRLLLARGEQLMELGQVEKANDDLNAAIKIPPNDPQIWLHRSNIFADAKNFPQAILDFRKAYDLYEERDEVWEKHLLRLLVSAGEYAQALTEFERAISMYPLDWELGAQGAVILTKCRGLNVGKKALTAATERCLQELGGEFSAEATYFLAVLSLVAEQFEDAQKHLRSAADMGHRIRSRIKRDSIVRESSEHPSIKPIWSLIENGGSSKLGLHAQ